MVVGETVSNDAMRARVCMSLCVYTEMNCIVETTEIVGKIESYANDFQPTVNITTHEQKSVYLTRGAVFITLNFLDLTNLALYCGVRLASPVENQGNVVV